MRYARFIKKSEDPLLQTLVPGRVYILWDNNHDTEHPMHVDVIIPKKRSGYDKHTQVNLGQETLDEHFEMLDDEEGEEEYDRHTRQLRKEAGLTKQAVEHAMDPSTVAAIMAGENAPPALTFTPEETQVEPGEGNIPGTLATRRPKNTAGNVRNELMRFQKNFTSISDRAETLKDELKLRIESKLQLCQDQAAGLEHFVGKLQGAIQTVNIYLGRDENITVIRTGERAPEDEPLKIRQLILKMDEEMAILYPEGVDFNNLTDFDQWVQDPQNLDAILPEKKGIVVLVPTTRKREYDPNPLVNALMNKENLKSYWLLRNGENLYRIHADLEVAGTLYPRQHELARYYHPGENTSQEPPRPGSKEYYKSMEQEEGKTLRSLQITLFLQGLLDRTLIFAPFPGNIKPNLCDPRTFGKAVTLVRDAEGWISDGRPTFNEWIKENNAKLIPGDRVVGAFRRSFSPHDRDDKRVHPEHAQGYDQDFIQTLIRKDSNCFKFLFNRTDTVFRRGTWGRDSYGEAKTKGSFTIYPSDKNFLNFDAISLEEIDYYIHDRLSRSSYFDMMETLQKAKKLKLQEEEQERPFITLLEQQMKAIEKPALPVTTELVRKITQWWKIKTNDRRTLLSAEEKAYTMILARYRKMAKEHKTLPPETVDEIVRKLAENPSTLRVTREINGDFQIIRKSLPDDKSKYFVDIIKAQASKDEAGENILVPLKETLWTHVPATANRAMDVLYSHPDLDAYPKKEYVTKIPPPLQQEAIDTLKQTKPRKRNTTSHLVLGITLENHIIYAYLGFQPEYSHKSPEVQKYQAYNRDGKIEVGYSEHAPHSLENKEGKWNHVLNLDCGEVTYGKVGYRKPRKNHSFEYPTNEETVWIDKEALETFAKWSTTYTVYQKKINIQNQTTGAIIDKVTKTIRHQWEKKEFLLYTEQGGDPLFWKDHLKTIREPNFLTNRETRNNLGTVLHALYEKNGKEALMSYKNLRDIFRAGDLLTPEDGKTTGMGILERRTDFQKTITALRGAVGNEQDHLFSETPEEKQEDT